MVKRLQEIFNIHPGEGRMVVLVLAYAMLLYFSNMMARTASYALFLGEYDAETLPYTYLFLMFIGPLVSLIYLRLNNRFALSKVLLGIHGFLLLTLILLPLVLNRTAAPVLLFILPIYFGVNNSLTISSFWNLLGRIYNLRQGKRLFSLLSSGEHMSTIVAGFMAPLFVARIGTVNLYWIGAFFMVMTIAMLVVINRGNAKKMDTIVGGKAERSPSTGISDLLKEPYVRLIFALFMLFIVGIFMVGNINYAQAEIRFPTADEMAAYVGIFSGIFGALSLIVQWVIAGRVLDRFGVRSMIMATPAGLFVFMFIFALVGTFTNWPAALFWISAAAAMWQSILDAVDSAAINIMYQPLPAHLRTQAQTSVIGIVYPLAIGLAGLFLILLYDVLGFDAVQTSYAALAVIVIWLFVGIRLGREYPRRLRQALQERSLGGLALARPDRASISVFENALGSPHPAAVLYALDMLEEVAPETLPGHLPALLDYPDDSVRIAALERVAGLSWPEKIPEAVTRLLEEDSNPAVRAVALRTWFAVSPEAATPSLDDYCRDAHAEIRQAAIAIIRRHPDPAIRQQAIALLNDMVASATVADRLVVARVLGETAMADDTPLLLRLLNDQEITIRQAALEAAAQARFPKIWPAVIPALAQEETAGQAATALVAGGEAALPAIETICLSPTADPKIVNGLNNILGRIGSPQALAILKGNIDHPHAAVRHQVLASLSRSAYQAAADEVPMIEAQLRAEAEATAELVAAQVDIGDEPEVFLAADALEQARWLETDNMFLLLSFVHDPQTVLGAREALQPERSDEDKKAYAIEALDILLGHGQKILLFPFFKEQTPAERLEEMKKLFPQELLGRQGRMRAILSAAPEKIDRATRICAIYSLGLLADKQAADAIVDVAGRFSDDPLLLETAFNSLQQLGTSLDDLAAAYPALAPAVERWQARDPQAMTVLQKMAVLKQVSIFSQLRDDVLSSIADLMVDVFLEPGEMIIHKGDPGDCLYVVVDGQLRVHDRQHTYETIGGGSVVGEMALLDTEPRSASVTADDASHLLQLDQEPFYDLLASQPQVAREFMGLLSRRLRARSAELSLAERELAAQPVLPLVGGQPGTTSYVAVQGQLLDLDKVFILKSVDLFGRSEDQLLGQVALLLEEVDLTGGEELFHQGDPGRSLYIVAMGQVRVHIEDRTLNYMGEGEVFGEMALLESEPRTATVTATTPTQLLRLDQEPFFELLEAQPDLARGIITILSGRLRKRIQELAPQGLGEMVAA